MYTRRYVFPITAKRAQRTANQSSSGQASRGWIAIMTFHLASESGRMRSYNSPSTDKGGDVFISANWNAAAGIFSASAIDED
eukprot:11947572-Prorocentrum_lima.AAC.1